jgi:hypothetical protein
LIEAYRDAARFLKKTPVMIFLIFIMAFALSPLKSNMFTFMIPFFVQCFFITGVLGVAKDYQELSNVGFKAVFVNGGKRFAYVMTTLFWCVLIFLVDFFIVLFFNILPMVIMGVKTNERYGGIILFLIFLLVAGYRVALFIGAFFAPVSVEKETGKYAIVKIKEVLWANPKFWLNILFMLVVYIVILLSNLYVQENILGDNSTELTQIIFFTLFDVIGEMFFAYLMIVNFFFYNRKISQNEELQIVYTKYNYNGKIKGIMGTFIM